MFFELYNNKTVKNVVKLRQKSEYFVSSSFIKLQKYLT